MTIPRRILLNPGPVTTTIAVKQALMVPDICHREREFTDLIKTVRRDLLKVVCVGEDQYTAIPFCASGTGAIEACISSVVAPHQKLGVIQNGTYAQRITAIAERYHIPVVNIVFTFDEPLVKEVIESVLMKDPDIHYVALVHHETSSGVLNPLTEIGLICRRLQRCFIVDAMSSYAGVDIDMSRDSVDFLTASANKCLQGMPGVSFVLAHRARLLAVKDFARSFYFDIYQQYSSLETTGEMPFTPPVQIMYALRCALDEYFTETSEARRQRYRRNYICLVAGLQQLGFMCVTPPALQSGLLVVVRFPVQREQDEFDFDALHDYLYRKGYTIYPKKLPIPDTFRLSCMGDLTEKDIQGFLRVLKQYMISRRRMKNHVT